MDNENQDKKKKHETESAADLERVTGEVFVCYNSVVSNWERIPFKSLQEVIVSNFCL